MLDVTSVRHAEITWPGALATHQRVSSFALLCSDNADGPWKNATADNSLVSPSSSEENVTIVSVCDARHWRLELLGTFGTIMDSPRTVLSSVRFFGFSTPSPTPPPSPPLTPPPSPGLPVWVPDYVAMERERLRCVARERHKLSLEAVATLNVLKHLPVQHQCKWSADDSFAAETTMETLRPFTDSLRVTGTKPMPLREAMEVVLQLLPTRAFGPLFDHWFDRSTTAAVLGQPLDSSVRGVWATWRRGRCAEGNTGMRSYVSELGGLPTESNKIDACFPRNRPVLWAHSSARAAATEEWQSIGRSPCPDTPAAFTEHCSRLNEATSRRCRRSDGCRRGRQALRLHA